MGVLFYDSSPPFEQAALAEFLRTRKIDRHIRSMRRIYAARREALLASLQANLQDRWTACGDAAGLHVTIRLKGKQLDDTFFERCTMAGIHVVPLEAHSIVKGKHEDALVLGFGHLKPEEIDSGVQLLARVINDSGAEGLIDK